MDPQDQEGDRASTRWASRPRARRRNSSTARGWRIRREYGPLAAVTPGTPGGLLVMLAEYGTLSLADVLGAGDADGRRLPDRGGARGHDRADEGKIKQWPYSTRALPPHPGETREAPRAGEIFRQPDLAATLRKLVEAEQHGARRRQEPQGGDPAPPTTASTRATSREEFVRGSREQGGLHHPRGPGQLAGARSRSRSRPPTRGSTSTSSPSGRRGRRCSRRSTSWSTWTCKAMGYNSAALHPHALPGDEPRLRRPRLLLRRSLLPARGADPRAALQGVRRRRGAKQIDWKRNDPDDQARRSLSVPGRAESLRRPAEELDGAPAADEVDEPRRTRQLRRASTRPSAPARPRSRPPTRRAGWSR